MDDNVDNGNANIDRDIDNNSEWHTVKEAAKILNVSERTIWRRKDQGKIEFKFEGGVCYFNIDSDIDKIDNIDKGADIEATSALVKQLQLENQQLRQELEELKDELREKEEEHKKEIQKKDELLEQNRNRQDTIILQLTRQLEQSQRLLEYHQDPWYRRWFRKKQTPDNEK